MSDQVSIDTAFKLIEIVSILGGGGLVAFRLGKNSQVVREAMRQQAAEIAALKDEIKELSELVTEVAVQSKRLDILEQRYEELRHARDSCFQCQSKEGDRSHVPATQTPDRIVARAKRGVQAQGAQVGAADRRRRCASRASARSIV